MFAARLCAFHMQTATANIRRSAMSAPIENQGKVGAPAMHTPPVVSAQAWKAAHAEMLVKEKSNSRARDALAAERRRMPWTEVKTSYAFEGPQGKVSLLDL